MIGNKVWLVLIHSDVDGEVKFMKRVFGCLCGFLFVVWIPVEAFAWGSGTHAYFAKQLGGGQLDSSELYGATAPDLFNLTLDSPYYEVFTEQTHRHGTKVKTKANGLGLESFALGFVSHNERWGADYTAHIKGRTTGDGYVVTQSGRLAPKLLPRLQEVFEDMASDSPFFHAALVATGLAHPVIETAIDLLIKRNEDPSIGSALRQSALDRPASAPDLLAATYAKPVARATGVTEGEAAQAIRDTEASFREAMIRYGEILMAEEPEAIQALAAQGVALLENYIERVAGIRTDISPEVMIEFLELALQQVEGDYDVEIALTLSYLQKRMASYLRSILK